MNSNPQNDEKIRRLLAWKRHERPFPGYFDSFPNQVIARLKAGERGQESSSLLRLFGDAPGWLQRLWATLEAKPLLAGSAGLAACALLVTGVVYSEKINTSAELSEAPGSPIALMADRSIVAPMPEQRATLVSFPSINGMPTSQNGSLFDEFQHSDFQRPQKQNWQLMSFPAGN